MAIIINKSVNISILINCQLHKSMFESASDINFIRVTSAYIDIFVRYQVGPDL